MKLRKLLMTAVLVITGAAATMAQMQMPAMPVDTMVRIGKLPNGLTYYIRHNEYPANVANFYIAQRVGSINENDDQRGLAHFLEHMAFNGSENFKGNGIIDYTRTLGVQFGRNLNAYTSTDETVYNINDVPTARQSAVDSCLLILKDWSNGLLLEEGEIDKERGVIHEEWRLRSSASQRMFERSLPQLYPGSKYAHRMPIGLMEIVDNFKPKALRDYYRKWYHPHNQAIIVVGNVDVDHIEAQIKKLFGGIKVPENAAEVLPEAVPDNNEAIYVAEKDKEQQMTQIMIMMKSDPVPDSVKSTVAYLADQYVKNVVSSMLGSRLREMAQDANCPFVQSFAGYGQYIMSKTKDCFEAVGIPKDGKDLETLQTLYKELRRVKEFGFTATEYERAKADYMSALEKTYTNRNKIENDNYCKQYYRHYLDNEPIPSVEDEYQMMNMLVPSVPVEAINYFAKELISESDTNLVVMSFTQEKEGKVYTTTEQMRDAIAKARAEKIEAYVDNVKNEPLIPEMPKKGTIKKETENKVLGYKELTLSNGAKVVLKKTDFKDDEVRMMAETAGGTNAYGAADYSNLKLLDAAIEYSGLGNFSHTELEKALAGKVAGVSAEFNKTRTTLSGSSTPKDLETMMQLIYLYFTNISKDEQSYNKLTNLLQTVLKNKHLKPESAFSDSVNVTMYCHDARMKSMEESDLSSVNYDRMLQIGKELLANPGAFTFTFVGNFDETAIRDLVCQYIASLPGNAKARKAVDLSKTAKGEVKNSFKRKMETPKAMAREVWYSNAPYTLENNVKADAAGQTLSMYYLKTIREDASAAYSVGAQGYASRVLDRQQVYMMAYCPMDPSKAELAVDLLHKGIADAAQKTDPEILQKVKEYMLKQAAEDEKKNDYWLGIISDYLTYGIDLHTDYKKTVQALTPESVSAFVKNVLLKDGNHIEVIMLPEE